MADWREGCVVGVDIGSTTTKAVAFSKEGYLKGPLMPTGAVPEKAGRAAVEGLATVAGIPFEAIQFTVATGYGRLLASASGFADKVISEISCHATGAFYLNPRTRLIVDIGGQDSKGIGLTAAGVVENFVMNDKCAAGTGRFLEEMAELLGYELDEIGEVSLRSESPCEISSTCTVFAETEVHALTTARKRPEDILAGLHKAVAKRVAAMVKALGVREEAVFTGGVSKNRGVVKWLEERLGMAFTPLPDDPQYAGALGAAVLGFRLRQ
ncbi:MAG: 2-hydroxyglutaryl-CoA dehydratase [Candidatus Rokubacteria bacterium]|nr:2-hydroxyglutaryl-CoA dehydratase [Candidatus Rokubacteria bacterium]